MKLPGALTGEGGGETAPDQSEVVVREDGHSSGALHEVGNALTVVLGWLSIARLRAREPALTEALDVARTHARLAYRISRQAIGAAVEEVEERSALSVARDALLGVTPEAQTKGVHVRLISDASSDEVLDDSLSASQILLNLLLNAIAFTPAGKRVTLELADAPGAVRFTVVDEGPGLSASVLDNWDDGTAPQSTRRGGAGIGLMHSRGLAERAGGVLEPVVGGPGARFALSWPVREAKSGARQPKVAASALTGLNVLLVEDDAAVRTLVEVGLEARGARVTSVESLAALEQLKCGEPVGAALVDLSPIAGDPVAAIREVRRRLGSGPLVVISGSPNGLPEAIAADVQAWVRKPFEMREVVDRMAELLEST